MTMALRTRKWIVVNRHRLNWLLRQEEILMTWGVGDASSDLTDRDPEFLPKNSRPDWMDSPESGMT